VYIEEDHFSGVDDNIEELYQILKVRILDLGNDVQVKTNKSYITFRRKKNFVTKSYKVVTKVDHNSSKN
jgi:predicted transport protein